MTDVHTRAAVVEAVHVSASCLLLEVLTCSETAMRWRCLAASASSCHERTTMCSESEGFSIEAEVFHLYLPVRPVLMMHWIFIFILLLCYFCEKGIFIHTFVCFLFVFYLFFVILRLC